MPSKSRTPPPPARRSKRPAELSALPPEALTAMAQVAAQARSGTEAIRGHLAIAQDLAQARSVFVSIYDSEKDTLAVASVRGRTSAAVAAAPPGKGPVGLAFAKGAVTGDLAHLAVPLSLEGHPFGVLSVVAGKRAATPELWLAFGAHLMACITTAQARDAAVRRTRDLETAVAGLKSLERARDELLGNVSHELKSPLTTIKAYLALARQEKLGPVGEPLRQAFETCDRNADRLLRLINDMLLMARLQGGQMTLSERPFGLKGLAQEVAGALQPLASAMDVTLHFDRGGEVYVKGDRDRVMEAVGNLLENAILYNRKGGEVRVKARAEGGVASLVVEDTGRGIAPDELPHVFDRFYRGRSSAHSGGSGLGLAIVRQVAQLHGGMASVTSTLGQGARFRFTLPLFAGAVGAGPRPGEPRDGAILVVEDDPDCREVLVQVLSAEGHVVVPVADAPSALAALASARPALVLLDLRLGGCDGRAVLQHVRRDERLEHTPVFVISGSADSAAGFHWEGPERIDAFFEKPLNLPRLLDRVQEVVRPASHAAGS